MTSLDSLSHTFHLWYKLWWIQILLRHKGYAHVISYINCRQQGSSTFDSCQQSLWRLQKYGLCPKSCLSQAITLFWMCPTSEKLCLNIGVSEVPQSNLKAHAWIERNQHIVWGKLDEKFRVLYSLPSMTIE